jgi:hypothetical protein
MSAIFGPPLRNDIMVPGFKSSLGIRERSRVNQLRGAASWSVANGQCCKKRSVARHAEESNRRLSSFSMPSNKKASPGLIMPTENKTATSGLLQASKQQPHFAFSSIVPTMQKCDSELIRLPRISPP